MTMLSFRVDQATEDEVELWADRLRVDRSAFLREALRRHLTHLKVERDSERWGEAPMTDGERILADIADWGPAEDWSDWADAKG